jgi:hypothetical protein
MGWDDAMKRTCQKSGADRGRSCGTSPANPISRSNLFRHLLLSSNPCPRRNRHPKAPSKHALHERPSLRHKPTELVLLDEYHVR